MGIFKRIFGGWKQGHLSADEMSEISDHVSRFVGPTGTVFHEFISGELHIDCFVVPEIPERDFQAVYITGMSGKPMPNTPDDLAYAELLVILPKEWPLGPDAFREEANYWPIRVLKDLARAPLSVKAGVYPGLSLLNGDSGEPYPGTPFVGMMLVSPDLFEPDFSLLHSGEKTINFYVLIPLTESEMIWKLNQSDPLAYPNRLASEGITPERIALIDPGRADFI